MRVMLPPDATLSHKEGPPEWAVIENQLTRLESSSAVATGRPAVIEYVETGRHFHRARVLTAIDPRDE
jgi:hypothetical protein